MNLLAIGDSVMWGQGNTENTKFVALVSDWLTKNGWPTQHALHAHSGAIAAPTPRDDVSAIWGEVPEASPSVVAQCADATINPADFDFVLVNGGINDVSAFHIVVADPFDPNGVEKVQQATREAFSGPVARVLVDTCNRFATARIVVLGYYPIVSELSSAREVAKLMKQMKRPLGVPNTIDWVLEHLSDSMIEVAIAAEKKRMVEQCAAFYALSDSLLRTLVNDLRDKFGPRVAYAVPAFGPENAFAADETFLWNGSDDPLHAERLAKYAEEAKRDPLAWPVYTPLASLCHPNTRGAKAYANAVIGALSTLGLPAQQGSTS